MKIKHFLIPIVSIFILSSRSSVDRRPIYAGESVLELREGVLVGQSFVAENDGLSAISFYLTPQGETKGSILVHLRPSAASAEKLALGELSFDEIVEPGFYKIEFEPQTNSHREDFYAGLEIEGEGSLLVRTSPGDSYLHGAAYIDDVPQDLQTTYQLHYDLDLLILGVFKEAFRWMALFLAALFLYCIPGLALVNLLFPKSTRLSIPSRISIGIGVSLALYPILFLWTDLINLHLGPMYAWIPGTGGILGLIFMHHRSLRMPRVIRSLSQWWQSPEKYLDLSFLVIIAILFMVRMIAIRDVDVPMWGDSYQHSMMAQLLVDNGGLFSSWQPYADLTTFTYHFGFHSHVAVLSWVTGLPAYEATLWVGQIFNGVAVLALYPLSTKEGKGRWSGLIVILIAGLWVQMPMAYTNWGRYTQLAGQVILPIIAFILWRTLEEQETKWGLLLLSTLLIGGLALTHYRILIFAILLVPVLFLASIKSVGLRRASLRTAFIGLFSAGIFFPWFIRVFEGRILDNFAFQLTTPASSTPSFLSAYNTIGALTRFLPIGIWILMAFSILWAAWKKEPFSLVIFAWWSLIFLSANPQILNLPGVGAISNFAVLISLYIPASLLIANFVSLHLSGELVQRYQVLFIAGIMILSIWGGVNQIDKIDANAHTLATRPDLVAADWIENNLLSSSRMLVNSTFAYGGTVIVGTDGGWWLPLLADVNTTLPPLNYGVEQGIQPDYLTSVNAFAAEVDEKGIDNPEVMEVLKDRGVTHVYIGQLHGRVNDKARVTLDPQVLQSSDQFRTIYNVDRVWIFEVVY